MAGGGLRRAARARGPVRDDLRAADASRSTPRRTAAQPTPSATSAIPGEYPYTRGVYPSMYRGRLWTMRQFAGLRHRRGDQRALPLPARPRPDGPLDRLRHADPDGARLRRRPLPRRGRGGGGGDRHPRRHGDAVRAGSTLGEVTTSMTINAPAAILLAFYVAAARGAGGPARAPRRARSRPTSSRSTSPRRSGASRSSRRCGWSTDMIEWCTEHMPRWHPISISGYHIREAGSTAQQELAFTLKDGFTYVEQAIERGLDVDDFAPAALASSSTPTSTSSRRSPSTAPRGGSGRARCARPTAPSARSRWRMRFHTQTAGVSLTAQQPHGEHRPHRDRGARRRARRHPVAAHQLLRRGARAADRGGGPDRAADPAGDRPRDRRHQHDRPARRLLLRRDAHRRDGARRLRVLRPDRRARRHGRGDQAELPPAGDRRRLVPLPAEVDARQRIVVGVNEYAAGGRGSDPDPADRPGARAKAGGRVEATKARRDAAEVERDPRRAEGGRRRPTAT